MRRSSDQTQSLLYVLKSLSSVYGNGIIVVVIKLWWTSALWLSGIEQQRTLRDYTAQKNARYSVNTFIQCLVKKYRPKVQFDWKILCRTSVWQHNPNNKLNNMQWGNKNIQPEAWAITSNLSGRTQVWDFKSKFEPLQLLWWLLLILFQNMGCSTAFQIGLVWSDWQAQAQVIWKFSAHSRRQVSYKLAQPSEPGLVFE